MFEELGLNVARRRDNGSNPRPDNRSGWLAGDPPLGADADLEPIDDAHTPDVIAALLAAERPDGDPGAVGLGVRLWDPSTQLRYRTKRSPQGRTAPVGTEG